MIETISSPISIEPLKAWLNATNGLNEVPYGWMPVTGTRPIMIGDPCLVWLQFHGAKFGFTKDDEGYAFLAFIGQKTREFEETWAVVIQIYDAESIPLS